MAITITKQELEALGKAKMDGLTLRDQTEAFFAGTQAARDFAQQIMIPGINGLLNPSLAEQAIAGTYLRMFAWVDSLTTLKEIKHLQAVASATRALFELSLDLRLLTDDVEGKWLDRFQAFIRVERFRVAEKLVGFYAANPELNGQASFTPRGLVGKAGERDEVQRVIKKYWPPKKAGQYPEHWTGKTVLRRCESLESKSSVQFYKEYYPILSWHVHAGFVGYSGLSAEILEATFALCHRFSQEFFLDSTLVSADGLKLTKAIDAAAIDSLRNIVERLKNLPGRVLVEEQVKQLRALAKTGTKTT